MNPEFSATGPAQSPLLAGTPTSRQPQRTNQMEAQTSFAASMFRVVISVLFVTMTIAFLTIPYSLSMHPGDPSSQLASAASRHLT
jgi:hypothetical protein